METGDRVGHFEVLVPLRAGGMGEIYLAEDMRTCEKVALKVLPERMRDNEVLQRRFEAEAEMYRTLSHPNVVTYLESGVDEGRRFIALEYIRGQDLAQLLDAMKRIPVDMALSMMLDITYALSFAHSKGIVHRDIKPQNVMLTGDNVIKLIDFGVAQAEQVDLLKTSAGTVLGSLCYNSPEQNHGRKVEERSDVYSLGLLFYEMLTGERLLPNKALSEVLLAQVALDDEIVPPSQRQVDLPPQLEKLVLRMVRFERAERPRSMGEVLQVLQSLAAGSMGELSGEQRDAKRIADRDLADTHYWKAMNHLADQQWLEALTEFEAILNLSLFEHSDFKKQVEDQLNFLSWKLQSLTDDPGSTPEAITEMVGEDGEALSGLQMDVLQKLHQIYKLKPHDGIREAMSNLLAFYKDELREEEKGRRGLEGGQVDSRTYVDAATTLSRLYEKIGNSDQKKLIENKLVGSLAAIRDPHEARDLWERVHRRRPDQPVLLQGYADFLARRGETERERSVREQLAEQLERREEWARAVQVWTQLAEKHADSPELGARAVKAREQLDSSSDQAEKLMQLLTHLELAQDKASAMNLCRRFLDEHPSELRVLEKLYELQYSQGLEKESAETLVQMGKTHFDRGDRASARDLFAEALHIKPRHPDAINHLVDILREEDPSLCDRSSTKEIRRELYVRLGMPEQAVRDLRKKLTGGPRDLESLQRIEEVYRRCHQPAEAAAAARDRVHTAIAQGDLTGARTLAEQFLSRYPEYRELLRPLASIPSVLRDPDLIAVMVHG